MAITRSFLRPVLLLLAVFAATIFYNGAGYNLHLLSVAAVLLFVWLSFAIARQDPAHVELAVGWLPALGIVYFAWLLVTPLLSPYPYVSSVRAAELAVLPIGLIAWLTEPRAKDTNFRASVWHILLVVALGLAVWGMVDFLVYRERARGPLLDPNAYAALINLFLVPAIWIFLHNAKSGGNQNWLLVSIAVLALALFMSLSRGGLLALLTVVPALVWLARKSERFYTRLLRLLLALAACYSIVKFGPVDPQALKSGIEGLVASPERYLEQDSSIHERILLWTSTWRMILDSNIFIGTGLGTFKTLYPPYRLEGEHSAGNFAHNDYLQVIQEGGLVQLFFLTALAVVVPLWLLHKNRSSGKTGDGCPITPGLMLAILTVSLQAMVNFIHLLAPIALLTGLYLAFGWESVTPRKNVPILGWGSKSVRPGVLKIAVIALLAVQAAGIVVDGFIFKLIGSAEPLLAYIDPKNRFAVLNASLALRPKNPTPRVMLIRHLIERAEQEQSAETRIGLLVEAEKETLVLSKVAPGYPLVSLLFGNIWAARGTPGDLMIARDYLEAAVRNTPHSTGIRTELIKVYRRLGQDEQAYRVVMEAIPWLANEASSSALGRFAKEAEALAVRFNEPKQASYWSSIGAQVSNLQRARR